MSDQGDINVLNVIANRMEQTCHPGAVEDAATIRRIIGRLIDAEARLARVRLAWDRIAMVRP